MLGPGDTFDDKYKVIEWLGEGGSGCVLKCLELRLERTVAVKILHSSLFTSEKSLARFRREARILSALSHPGIVQIYHHGISRENQPYFSMEYLEGDTLARLLKDESLSSHRVVKIALQLSAALEHVHARRFIHRDLKPENIMLVKVSNEVSENLNDRAEQTKQVARSEQVKIIDFGLGAITGGDSTASTAPTLRPDGSLLYMSPEQCRGQELDERSDIYSLACICYQMLCGSPPFVADEPYSLLNMHLNSAPAPLPPGACSLSADTRDSWNAILTKALQKNPADRYQCVAEFAKELSALSEGTFAPPRPNRISFRRAPYVMASCAALVCLAGGVAFFSAPLPTNDNLPTPRRSVQSQLEEIPKAQSEERQRRARAWLSRNGETAALYDKAYVYDVLSEPNTPNAPELRQKALNLYMQFCNSTEADKKPSQFWAAYKRLQAQLPWQNNIGSLFPLHLRALRFIRDKNSVPEGCIYISLAGDCFKLGKVKEAQQYLEQGLKVLQPTKSDAVIAMVCASELLFKLGQKKDAETLLCKSLAPVLEGHINNQCLQRLRTLDDLWHLDRSLARITVLLSDALIQADKTNHIAGDELAIRKYHHAVALAKLNRLEESRSELNELLEKTRNNNQLSCVCYEALIATTSSKSEKIALFDAGLDQIINERDVSKRLQLLGVFVPLIRANSFCTPEQKNRFLMILKGLPQDLPIGDAGLSRTILAEAGEGGVVQLTVEILFKRSNKLRQQGRPELAQLDEALAIYILGKNHVVDRARQLLSQFTGLAKGNTRLWDRECAYEWMFAGANDVSEWAFIKKYWDEAIMLADERGQQLPNFKPLLLFYRGRAEANLSNKDEALRYFSEACQMAPLAEPLGQRIYLEYAKILLETGRFEDLKITLNRIEAEAVNPGADTRREIKTLKRRWNEYGRPEKFSDF